MQQQKPLILNKLRKYIAIMAPHQKERDGGKLIIQAAERIEELEDFVKSLLIPEENGLTADASLRDQARILLGEKPVETK